MVPGDDGGRAHQRRGPDQAAEVPHRAGPAIEMSGKGVRMEVEMHPFVFVDAGQDGGQRRIAHPVGQDPIEAERNHFGHQQHQNFRPEPGDPAGVLKHLVGPVVVDHGDVEAPAHQRKEARMFLLFGHEELQGCDIGRVRKAVVDCLLRGRQQMRSGPHFAELKRGQACGEAGGHRRGERADLCGCGDVAAGSLGEHRAPLPLFQRASGEAASSEAASSELSSSEPAISDGVFGEPTGSEG